MKIYISIAILALLFLSACKKDSIISESADLPYFVYDESALTDPIILDNSFTLLTTKSSGISLINIDTMGVKTELLDLSALSEVNNIDSAQNYNLLQADDNSYFVTFSYNLVQNGDTSSNVKILKINKAGSLLWHTNIPIENVSSFKIVFNSVYKTQNGGIAVVLANARGPEQQKYIIKVSYVDTNGNNSGNYVSLPFDGNYSHIFITESDQVVILSKDTNSPITGNTSTVHILNREAEIIESKMIPMSITFFYFLKEIDGKFIISGTSHNGPVEEVFTYALLDSDFNVVFTETANNFWFYSSIKYNESYLVCGEILNQTQNLAWALINSKGEITYKDNIETDYVSSAIAAIPNSENQISILSEINSFGLYNNLAFLKISIEK